MIAADLFELPAGVVDWTILPDSCRFSLRLEHGKAVFHTEDSGSSVLNSYSLNDAVDSEQSLIYLSGFLTDDGVSGKVAEAMVFFPQINIFDTKAGLTRSLATSKACRYWKTVVSGMPDMSTVEYYEGIAATEDYILRHTGESLWAGLTSRARDPRFTYLTGMVISCMMSEWMRT